VTLCWSYCVVNINNDRRVCNCVCVCGMSFAFAYATCGCVVYRVSSRQGERHISVDGRNSFVQSRWDRGVYQRRGDSSIARASIKSYMNDNNDSFHLPARCMLSALLYDGGVLETRTFVRGIVHRAVASYIWLSHELM